MVPGANMMPMMMMMAGLTATATVGKDVAFRVIDTAKSAVVQYELGGIRDTLIQEHIYGGIEDLVDDDAAFAEHLVESMQSKGGRDVSLDYWDQPYQLEKVSEDRYVVFSTGPNMYRDGGCSTTADSAFGGGWLVALLIGIRRRHTMRSGGQNQNFVNGSSSRKA